MMARPGGSIVDITDVCASVPFLPPNLVSRENILNSIERIFDQGLEIVCVEGDENYGKTTLLFLVAKRYPNRSAYLYIRPVSSYAYHPTAIREELCNQLHWVIYSTKPPADSPPDDATLRSRIFELRRLVAREKRPFYFVVDGLGELPQSSRDQLNELLDMLPFGTAGFRFIFSGEVDQIFRGRGKKLRIKALPLHPFSFPETKEYFSAENLEESAIRELFDSFKGIPGQLEAARRLLQGGVPIAQLTLESEIRDLFEMEWKKLDDLIDISEPALALIAFAKHKLTIAELAEIFSEPVSKLESEFKKLTFLSIEGTSKEISFVSGSFTRFAQDKLRRLESKVLESYTEFLLKSPHSSKSLELAPQYLRYSKPELLITYLGNEYFQESIAKTRSLEFLRQQAQIGSSIAFEFKSPDMYRFAVLQSLISDLYSATADSSEVEALLALGDYSTAMGIANGATLIEDRLLLLSTVARSQKQMGIDLEPALADVISMLAQAMEEKTLPTDKAIEIATELFSVNPEHAIALVKCSIGSGPKRIDMDAALTQLSFATLATSSQSAVSDTADLLRQKISNPTAQAVVSSLSLFLGPESVGQVLEELSKLSKPADQILLLRHWCKVNRRTEGALDVVNFAIDTALRSTSLSLSASFYLDIAAPLPFAKDFEKLREIIDHFDSQRATIDRLGPTEAAAHLQLRLGEAEFNCAQVNGIDRLVSTYLDFDSSLTDQTAPAEFYAEFLGLLDRIDPEGNIFKNEGLRSLVEANFDNAIDPLLADSADHKEVFHDVLLSLSEDSPSRAVELAQKLNAVDRRETALNLVVRRAVKYKLDRSRFFFAADTARLISDPIKRDRAVLEILLEVSKLMDPDDFLEVLPSAKSLLSEVRGAAARSRASIALIANCLRLGVESLLCFQRDFANVLEQSWSSLDRPWLKVKIGFEACASLAKHDSALARNYFEKANQFRKELHLQSDSATRIFESCVNLALRSFSALLDANSVSDEDRHKMEQLIERVPGAGGQARFWANLALAFFRARRPEDGRTVVFQRIRPLLDGISVANLPPKYRAICRVAPALWIANRQTAVEMIQEMDQPYRDEAYSQIVECLMRNQMSPDEPFDPTDRHHYAIDFDTAVNVIDLLSNVESDGRIYWFVRKLLDSINVLGKKGTFSREQINRVADRIERQLLPKLPTARYIQHLGYKVLLEARIRKIRSQKAAIDDLAKTARAIGNKADAAFVLIELVELMTSRDGSKRMQLLHDAYAFIALIPSRIDQISRYEMLANAALSLDKLVARQAIQQAFGLCNDVGVDAPDRFVRQQRSIVDLAYRLDKDFADSLAALLNDDPSKESAHRAVTDVISTRVLRKRILDENAELDHSRDGVENLPEASWKSLGALNAGAVVPVHLARANELVKLASGLDLRDAYPVFSFAIEDLRMMYGNTSQSGQYVRNMFEAVLRNVEFLDEALHAISQVPFARYRGPDASGSESIVVREGEGEKAFGYIRNWLLEHTSEELVICDPYFGPDDLQILLWVKASNPGCRAIVLTSEAHQKNQGISRPYEDAYRDSWRNSISEAQDPPNTLVVVAGHGPDGKPPVHERWILAETGGLRLGTSLNGFGKKISEISRVTKEEALMRRQVLDPFILQRRWQHLDTRVSYSSFSL